MLLQACLENIWRIVRMPYFSKFYLIEVRDEIVREFTDSRGEIDDMMAGFYEMW